MTLLWPSTAWGASVVAYVCVSYLLVHDTTSKLDMPAMMPLCLHHVRWRLQAQITCWCPGCRRCRAVKTIFIGWWSRRRPKKRPAPQHIRYRYMKYTFFITCSFILAESRSATNTGSGFTTLVQWVSTREKERERERERTPLIGAICRWRNLSITTVWWRCTSHSCSICTLTSATAASSTRNRWGVAPTWLMKEGGRGGYFVPILRS